MATLSQHLLSRLFLFFLLGLVLYGCFLVFRPFLIEILVAAILVSIFYSPYEKLASWLGGRRNLASVIMCLVVALLVIIPLVNIIILAAQEARDGYDKIIQLVSDVKAGRIESMNQGGVIERFNLLGIDRNVLQNVALEFARRTKEWLVGGAASLIRGTTNFIISLLLILFTMFFFFVDGPRMLETLMRWTPLPNKYDKKIFQKFRDVSYSTVMSTFVTAIAQGVIGAIGFLVVGLPAFLPGIAIAFFSLLPYIGASLVWLPAVGYLLWVGKFWQAIFLLGWGALIVSWIDNFMRAYLIKGQAQVHPIFIIFSILGGISLFGFWGVVFGPLIIALAVTVLHIYELEYDHVLEHK